LRVGVEVDASAAFLFFFSAIGCEWACIAVVGFRARGPVNTGARGGLPTVEELLVALVVATAGRTGPVLPNRFHHIGGVTHAGMRSGAIPAGGGESGGADDDGQLTWAGGAAGQRELNFFGAELAGRGNMREALSAVLRFS
jgi:hypothetical protein